jgi:hypothetical protein
MSYVSRVCCVCMYTTSSDAHLGSCRWYVWISMKVVPIVCLILIARQLEAKFEIAGDTTPFCLCFPKIIGLLKWHLPCLRLNVYINVDF